MKSAPDKKRVKAFAKFLRRKRGFASLPLIRRREIAAMGGASHSREHMRAIGALGGKAKGGWRKRASEEKGKRE